MPISSRIKRLARRFGVDVHRVVEPKPDPTVALLSAYEVDLVVDVGANVGQYALKLRQRGYRGRIVSFEPLSSAHSLLVERAKEDAAWTAGRRLAIGARAGIATINISANSVSSSLRPMAAAHLTAAPDSAYVGSEEVDVCRLDGLTEDLEGAKRMFLKVDTQGFEREVIEGAEGILDRLVGVQAELSLTTLYEGQSLWMDVVRLLDGMEFSLCRIVPLWNDPHDGRLLQIDGVFFRTSARQSLA